MANQKKKKKKKIEFQVLKAAKIFWDMTPHSPFKV
jgi:hypothetical protein